MKSKRNLQFNYNNYYCNIYFPRSVIINLAKSLSTNLQKLMAANNVKIDNVLNDQQNIASGANPHLNKCIIVNKMINYLKYPHQQCSK